MYEHPNETDLTVKRVIDIPPAFWLRMTRPPAVTAYSVEASDVTGYGPFAYVWKDPEGGWILNSAVLEATSQEVYADTRAQAIRMLFVYADWSRYGTADDYGYAVAQQAERARVSLRSAIDFAASGMTGDALADYLRFHADRAEAAALQRRAVVLPPRRNDLYS